MPPKTCWTGCASKRRRIGPATLTRYAEVVQAGLTEMRGATAPRLLLEVICARLLLPSASDAESALLQRVERIETRLDMSIPHGDRPPSRPRLSGRHGTRSAPSHHARTDTGGGRRADAGPGRAQPGPRAAAGARDLAGSGEPNAAAVRTLWPTVRDKVRHAVVLPR